MGTRHNNAHLNQNNNVIILESKGNKANEIFLKLSLLLNDSDFFSLVKNNNEEFSRSYLSYNAITKSTLKSLANI